MLLKFTPQGVAGFPDGFKDKAGFYYGMRATLSVIAHNPKIVSEKDAPKTWKDLLNPRWSGKMVTAHPGYSGIIMTHVLALVNAYGWDYFRDLAKNKLHIVQSANDPAGVVASGERPVGVNGAEYFYYKTQKQGNPIKIIYPKEGVPLVVSPVAIAKDAPHPNAAKLFTEFIFAKESQQLLADKEGLYTGHPDVTYPADKPKLKDLKLLPRTPTSWKNATPRSRNASLNISARNSENIHARFSNRDPRSSRPHGLVRVSIQGSDFARMDRRGASSGFFDALPVGRDFSRQRVG